MSWDELDGSIVTREQAEEILKRCISEGDDYLKYNQSRKVWIKILVETAIAETLKLIGDKLDKELI